MLSIFSIYVSHEQHQEGLVSLYILSRAAQALARRLEAALQPPASQADPIDHPAIAAMDLREIADLPLAPQRRPSPAARAPRSDARAA